MIITCKIVYLFFLDTILLLKHDTILLLKHESNE